LAGRWACLAVRAHVRGALDYERVTDKAPLSLIKEGLVIGELGKEANGEMARIFMQAASTMGLPQDYLARNIPTLVDSALQATVPWLVQKKAEKVDMQDPATLKTFYEKMVAAKNKIKENKDKEDGTS